VPCTRVEESLGITSPLEVREKYSAFLSIVKRKHLRDLRVLS